MAASKTYWQDYQSRLANRPGQPAPGEPHWIVLNLSRHHELPEERKTALFYRHPSELAAEAEAMRLAHTNPGKRFAVYASCGSHKIEPDPPPQEAA